MNERDGWFGADPTLWTYACADADVAHRWWFYEDGYKITCETTFADAMLEREDRMRAACGATLEDALVICPLPVGHECKHFAVSWVLFRDASVLPVSAIKIERARCAHGDPTCPCADGDACHYEGPDAWPAPAR